MLRGTAERLNSQTKRRHIKERLLAGMQRVFHEKNCTLLFAGYILLLSLGVCFKKNILNYIVPDSIIAAPARFLYGVVFLCFAALSVPGLLVLIGTPFGARYISDRLHRAGVVNKIDEPPLLTKRYRDGNNPSITVYEFMTAGISRYELEKLQPQIESALDCFVVKIADGPSRNRVLLYTVSSGSAIPETLLWDKTVKKDSVLIFGRTIAGTDVTFDIEKIPHILLGGSTGSGKTVLLRLLLHQCIAKGYEVHIADFKGGIDYSGEWHQTCKLVTTTTELLPDLRNMVAEMDRRKTLFLAAGAANISQYNTMTGEKLPHIIFAVDELAELLDKTGASKEQKAEIDEIISLLSSIARLGRAFGINLILATQRPDANILPGQIKNNLDIRACGRADKVLSQIILDNSDAADRIPKDSHYFLLQDGTLFQPYVWND